MRASATRVGELARMRVPTAASGCDGTRGGTPAWRAPARPSSFGRKPNPNYPAFPRAASTLHIPAPRAAI
jgi:hypothetical protein